MSWLDDLVSKSPVTESYHRVATSAGTDNSRRTFAYFAVDSVIDSVFFTPDGALVANNTDYATFELWTDDGAGTTALIASINTKASGTGSTGSWSIGVDVNIAKVQFSVKANTRLYLVEGHGGAGVNVPECLLTATGSTTN